MSVDKIAWIVGLKLGVMHESQDIWLKKILGPARIRRIYQARGLVCLVLYEECGVSYNEIAHMIGDRFSSAVSRSLKGARKWAEDNPKKWAEILTSVRESITAEQEHHARKNNLKVGFSE